jgi:hypothetical protein
MAYELAEIGNLIVVISGALGSLLLIVFKSRCKSIFWGCITRDVKDDDEEKPLQRTDENASGAT